MTMYKGHFNNHWCVFVKCNVGRLEFFLRTETNRLWKYLKVCPVIMEHDNGMYLNVTLAVLVKLAIHTVRDVLEAVTSLSKPKQLKG